MAKKKEPILTQALPVHAGDASSIPPSPPTCPACGTSKGDDEDITCSNLFHIYSPPTVEDILHKLYLSETVGIRVDPAVEQARLALKQLFLEAIGSDQAVTVEPGIDYQKAEDRNDLRQEIRQNITKLFGGGKDG